MTDTLFDGEGATWIGKKVELLDGSAVFEASWSDSLRIWRITTTSPAVVTRSGVRVGLSLGELRRMSETIELRNPEGRLFLLLSASGVGAMIDSASERAYLQQHRPGTTLDPAALPKEARLASLIVTGSCPPRE